MANIININGSKKPSNSLVSTLTAEPSHVLSGKTFIGKNNTNTQMGTIATKTSSDLSASGAIVTVPAGYYPSETTKSVNIMTLPSNTATSVTSGYTHKTTINRKPYVQYLNIPPGYNSAGTYYTISAVAEGTAGTPTATKASVWNHSIRVTPSVTNTEGYIIGGTQTGTAVTVTASELASGYKEITENGTDIDVVGYSAVNVDVPTGKYTGTITFTSGGTSSYRPHIQVNGTGTWYNSDGAVFKYSEGDTLSIYVQGRFGGGRLYENGVKLRDGGQDPFTYVYTPPRCDITVTINASYDSDVYINYTIPTTTITQNGTYDVCDYNIVNVDVVDEVFKVYLEWNSSLGYGVPTCTYTELCNAYNRGNGKGIVFYDLDGDDIYFNHYMTLNNMVGTPCTFGGVTFTGDDIFQLALRLPAVGHLDEYLYYYGQVNGVDTFVQGEVNSLIEPTGSVNITANGTYDVTNYASANVSIGAPFTATITRTGIRDTRYPLYCYVTYNENIYYTKGDTFVFNAGDTIRVTILTGNSGQRILKENGVVIVSETGLYWTYDYTLPAYDVDIQLCQIFTNENGSVNISKSESNYELIASTTYSVSTTSTTAITVGTFSTGNTSIWTSDKMVYVKIRHKGGRQNGYYFGSDCIFSINAPGNNLTATESYLMYGTSYYQNSAGYLINYNLQRTNSNATVQGYGVYATKVYSNGDIDINARYSSSNTLIINGTFFVDVYLLDWPGGIGPFNE